MDTKNLYWAVLIAQLRRQLCCTQEDLAEKLDTDQATVSRWEHGAAVPRTGVRLKLETMAKDAGLITVDEIAAIVRASPFPMILTDRASRVLAASPTSGFQEGRHCIEQVPVDERDHFLAFRAELEASGFWEQHSQRQDYVFEVQEETRAAIVMPITLRGVVYALVQKNA
jgi:transcriptional regulator with XRE-family HTH domain